VSSKKWLLVVGAALVVALLALTGCSSQSTTTEKKDTTATTAKAEKAKGLVEQVKETGHWKYFGLQVAKGPDGTKAGRYGDNCISCHSAVKMLDDKDAKLADFFPGGKYDGKTEGISCRVCHKWDPKEGITLQKTGWAACADCHTSGAKPTLGSEVHHPQGEMVKGIGVGEVADTPSFKYSSVKDFACYDCHVTNSQKHDFMVPGVTSVHDQKDWVNRVDTKVDYAKMADMFKQEKCQGCHADSNKTVDTIKQQQAEIGKKLEDLKKVYDDWSKKTATMDKNDPKVKAFKDGATYFTYVETDGSKGVHNYQFAKALLAKAEEKFATLK